jgi:hypothetical protein
MISSDYLPIDRWIIMIEIGCRKAIFYDNGYGSDFLSFSKKS